jgi:2-hydroxycyclohexanecarboxyl-CoA dehydrogenase
MDFKNKTIIVTGGASGIGKAITLLAAEKGADVFVGDINEKGGLDVQAQARDAGLKVTFNRLDLADAASIDDFAKTVHARTGGSVDCLVNAAGWEVIQPFLQNSPDLWERIIRINLLGAIRLTHAVVTKMSEKSSGAVVNIASDAGRVGSMGEVVYSSAKGGLIAFTKALAREMARYKVRVNCVCPGPTDTPMFHAQENERIKEALIKAVPFRRLGRPEEIADAVMFFLSPQSDFVTGQVLSVSGGLTMVD